MTSTTRRTTRAASALLPSNTVTPNSDQGAESATAGAGQFREATPFPRRETPTPNQEEGTLSPRHRDAAEAPPSLTGPTIKSSAEEREQQLDEQVKDLERRIRLARKEQLVRERIAELEAIETISQVTPVARTETASPRIRRESTPGAHDAPLPRAARAQDTVWRAPSLLMPKYSGSTALELRNFIYDYQSYFRTVG